MTGRKLLGLTAIGALLSLGTAAPGYAAAIQVGNSISINGAPGRLGWAGGAFRVTGPSTVFDTFCLEYTEHIDFSSNFKVSDISGAAYGGGGGSVPSSYSGINYDPISPRTQYLYYHFVKGDLQGYSGSGNDQMYLQQAIWYFEDEIALSGVTNQKFVTLATAYLGGAINSVQVMNIVAGGTASGNYYNPTYQRQSQLIFVPEPGTMILLGSGLLGLALAGRKKFRK
jgi:hypothetical protein